MRNGQRFTATRDLVAGKTRLHRAKIDGEVVFIDGMYSWDGDALVPFTPENFKRAKRMLGREVSIRGIGQVLVEIVENLGDDDIAIQIVSTGKFTIPKGK